MLTSRQRAYLKSLGHNLDVTTHIGKEGISDAFIDQLDTLLEKRELVKINIQKGALEDTKVAANEVARLLKAEFVQAIGRKFIIYRQAQEDPEIVLPKR